MICRFRYQRVFSFRVILNEEEFVQSCKDHYLVELLHHISSYYPVNNSKKTYKVSSSWQVKKEYNSRRKNPFSIYEMQFGVRPLDIYIDFKDYHTAHIFMFRLKLSFKFEMEQ